MLGKTSTRILKHAIAVMRPRGGVFDVDVDEEVCQSMVGFLEYLPAPARLSFPLGLRLLEYGPFLFREGFRTFSSMDEETAARYLHHWERAGSAPSLLYQGVRALVFVCFYQHPRILAAMEVDWQGRADERVRFRARIMRDQILRQASAAGASALAASSHTSPPPGIPATANRQPSDEPPADAQQPVPSAGLQEDPMAVAPAHDEQAAASAHDEAPRPPRKRTPRKKPVAVVDGEAEAPSAAEAKTPAGGAS